HPISSSNTPRRTLTRPAPAAGLGKSGGSVIASPRRRNPRKVRCQSDGAALEVRRRGQDDPCPVRGAEAFQGGFSALRTALRGRPGGASILWGCFSQLGQESPPALPRAILPRQLTAGRLPWPETARGAGGEHDRGGVAELHRPRTHAGVPARGGQ